MSKVGSHFVGVLFMSMVLATSAHAGNVTFATFTQVNAEKPFTLGNDGTYSNFDATNVLINFAFSGISNPALLPAVLQPGHVVQANLSVTGSSSTSGTDTSGISEDGFIGGFTILLPVAIDGHTNLLSGTYSNGGVTGTNGGSGAGFNASSTLSGSILTFTSDFITFSGSSRAMSIAMTGSDTPLTLEAGLLGPMSLTGTGNFSSDPAPSSIPEPSTTMLLGSSLVALGFWAKKRIA